MSDTNNSDVPFERLGKRLKRMRTSRRESLAEVSGAVEINADELNVIEQGKVRPGEEILLLLINHFGVNDDEADNLWGLAGYDQDEDPTVKNDINPSVMITPADLRIVYTDMVHVTVNNFGVVMNFMQSGGPNSQPMAISRVGMSREHAQSILEILQKTLNAAPKSLPAPKPPTEPSA